MFHSGTENCEADSDALLLKLNDLRTTQLNIPIIPTLNTVLNDNIINKEINNLHCKNVDTLEKNFIRYICGYLLKKCLEIHSCIQCINYSKAHEELDETSLFCFLKAYKNTEGDTFDNLKMPHHEFVNLIIQIENIFQHNFQTFILQPKVCHSFYVICKNLLFKSPCELFPTEYVIRLYLRLRIYYTLKNINRNFKNINKNKLIIWRNE